MDTDQFEEDFDAVYSTMIGTMRREYRVPGIENAFAEGGKCDREYTMMVAARERICQQLGLEDPNEDLEIMVGCLEAIQEELCRRMYALGRFF